MKLWISKEVKPSGDDFVVCDSLLSAYECFINWKKHESGAMLIAGDKTQTITEIYCDADYFNVISRYLARQYTLAPMPKIVKISPI